MEKFGMKKEKVSFTVDRDLYLWFKGHSKSQRTSMSALVNKFIMDLYNGMRIAINHLDSLGVNIKLYPYDTKRDPNVVKDILKSSSFNKMDLIIGPLYNLHHKEVFV